MPRIRKDIASLGADWNPTVEWYAKAVGALQAKAVTDRTSWRYLGGIHGFDKAGWITSGVIQATDPLPPSSESRIWNQCQHATWFFLPWHRIYLHAFEEIVAATVKALGGPADWALPYWNYFRDAGSLTMPAAFTAATMPDGSANPLRWAPRFQTVLDGSRLNLDAMAQTRYTAAPGTLGFGGGVTHFNHFGGAMTGALEFNPHNEVHSRINYFMGNPDYAALDPIFWLHHCNVDRLWAAWLTQDKNKMENRKAFLRGPARKFEMPGADGKLHVFTPADTMPGKKLAPTYDDLQNGTGLPPVASALEEVSGAAPMPAKLTEESPPPATLVGASTGRITVTGTPATADVKLESQAAGLAEAAGLVEADQRIFLNLENVRGSAPSASLTLRIGAPAAGAAAAEDSSYLVPVALFGLAKSSAQDGEHGGNGINVAIDITEIANKLAEEAGAAVEELQVRIEQVEGENPAPVTVERISIYKQPVG